MDKRLFFKHLFTSIKKRPFQPFLLVFVIMTAVATCITVLNVQNGIQNELDYQNQIALGSSDFRLNSNVLSDRFIPVRPAQEYFGERADICGILGLPIYTEDNTMLTVCVTDFEDYAAIFPLYLQEEVRIEEDKRSSACILTEEKAAALHRKTGDTITLSVAGYTKTYTVYGIAKYSFLNSYGMLIDYTSLAEILTDGYIFPAFNEYDFPIAGTVFVHAHDDTDAVLEDLNVMFPTFSIISRYRSANTMYASEELFLIMVLITVLFVVLVIYCCCNILAKQRQEETFLLACVGARPSVLYLLSMAEIALYAVIGSALGCVVALPLEEILITSCSLVHNQSGFSVGNAVLSIGLVFTASQFGLFLYRFFSILQKKNARKKKRPKQQMQFPVLLLVCVVFFLLFLLWAILERDSDKFIPAIVALFFLFCGLFFLGRDSCRPLPAFFLHKKNLRPETRYACKNVRRMPTLANTTGISTLFFTMIFIVLFLIAVMFRIVSFYREFIIGDFLYTDQTVETETLREIDGVRSVSNVLYEGIPYADDEYVILLSTDDLSCLSERMGIQTLPQGNAAYMNEPLATKYHIEIGDTFTMKLGGKQMDFVLTDTIACNGGFVVFDAEYWGIPYSQRLITAKENYDRELLCQNLKKATSDDLSTVLVLEDVKETALASNVYYADCGLFFLTIVSVFSIIGMGNNIASLYRSRQEEFYSYSVAGMENRRIKRMKNREIWYTFSAGFIIFTICTPLILFALYEAGLGFMFNIFYPFL